MAEHTGPTNGGVPRPPGGGSPSAGDGSGDVPSFRVANLLRMQQKLLTGGGRAGAGPDGSGPVPDKQRVPGGVFGIRDYLDVIARRWVCLVVPLVLVPVFAWIYTQFQADEYEAVSRLLLTRTLVGQGAADDIFTGGGYITSTALAQVAKLERVRKSAADYVVAWVEGDDSAPLARLWAGKKPALPEWQIARVLSAGAYDVGPAVEEQAEERAEEQTEGQDERDERDRQSQEAEDPEQEPSGQPDPEPGDESAEQPGQQPPDEEPFEESDELPDVQPSDQPAEQLVEQPDGQPGVEAKPRSHDTRWALGVLVPHERDFLCSPEDVFDYISGAVHVLPDTQNVAVVLAARSSSPIVAAAASDALAIAMLEEFARLKSTRSSVSIINRHLESNEENLRRVNEDIARLRHEAASSDAVEGFPLELERQYNLLKDHEFNLRSLDYMIEEAERRVELLGKRAKHAAEDVPPPEQLIQRLIDLELQHDEYAARYTVKHPRMRKIQDEMERTRRKIQQYSEHRKELGVAPRDRRGYYDPDVQLGLEEAKLAGLKARKGRLAATIQAVRGEIEKSSAQTRSLKYELLQTSRKVLQDTAVALRTRLHRAQLIEGVDMGPAGGAVEAVPAEVELVGPRRFQTVFLGVLVGALAGVLLALLTERLDETVRLPAEIRAIAGLPTLQVIPHFKRSIVIRPEETVSGIANTFAVLRNHIRYSAAGSPERCVLFTSAIAGEGKSLVAVNLAISFAQEGNRTCLVDADVQKGERHAVEEAVKLAWDPNVGLTGFLDGDAEYDHVLVPSIELPNLSFISSGGHATNPPRALRSERAAALFQRLQEDFDVVIADAPPVLPVVDAAILAGYCRAVIQVVRHGYTRRGELEESVRRLRHVGAPVVGLILNCVPRAGDGYYDARRYYARRRA